MAKTISDLPDEILVEITRYLQIDSLKNARQVCNRLAKAGASRLFRRIYFAPRKETMELFTRITSEPAFAVGVTELVYDARLFWRFLAGKRAHRQTIAMMRKKVWNEPEPDISAEELSGQVPYNDDQLSKIYDCSSFINLAAKERSYNRYLELFEQQSDILDSGTDFTALCHGLQNLPNLKIVSIRDKFGPGSDYIDLHDPLPRWYLTWSSSFFRDTLGPAGFDHGRSTRFDLKEHGYDNVANHKAFFDHPWDWRGVKNCLKALTMRRSSITHLHYGCQNSKLPINVLADPGVSKGLESITQDLQCLKFDSGTLGDESEFEPFGGASEAKAVHSRMLKGAQQLTTLSESLMESQNERYGPAFHEATWPKLRVLDIGNRRMNLWFLKVMCQQHQRTLKELKLRNVYLVRQDGFENNACTWDDVARELSPILQLSDLSLGRIREQREQNNSNEVKDYILMNRMKAVGDQLMDWVPSGFLEGYYEADSFRLERWHATETIHEDRYRPAK